MPDITFKKSDEIGDCYQAAAVAALTQARATCTDGHGNEIEATPIVVHGTCAMEGERWGHAWIEFEHEGEPLETEHGIGLVLDTSRGQCALVPAPIYYEGMSIEPESCERYTYANVRERIIEYGHLGPWSGEFAVRPCESPMSIVLRAIAEMTLTPEAPPCDAQL